MEPLGWPASLEFTSRVDIAVLLNSPALAAPLRRAAFWLVPSMGPAELPKFIDFAGSLVRPVARRRLRARSHRESLHCR